MKAAFTAYLRSKSLGCHCLEPNASHDLYLPSETDHVQLMHWLQGLPKRTGLLAFDSLQARQVVEACQLGQVDVPHEIAVLGGEQDQLSCTISKPQISSIDQSPYQVGWTAAELLGDSLSRQVGAKAKDSLAPGANHHSAIHGCSSGGRRYACFGNPLYPSAEPRTNPGRGHLDAPCRSVAELWKRGSASIWAAHRPKRFAVRMDRAVQLLCDTSWAMPRIAAACGFDRPELLTRAFRRELNLTPSEFRRQHQQHFSSVSPPD